MDEQLDNDLRDRIRDVFENYEDPSADEGWLQLRKKFPEEQKKRNPVIWFWLGVAAMLFLFLGIGLWINNKQGQPEKISQKKLKNVPYQQLTADTKSFSGIDKTKLRNPKKTGLATGNHLPVTKTAALKKFLATVNHHHDFTAATLLSKTATDDTLHRETTDAPATGNTTNNTPAAKLTANFPPQAAKTNPIKNNPGSPARSIDSMFAKGPGIVNQEIRDKTKKIRFAVYEATFFNYAKGSSNTINVGAGLSADIRISNNLKLETGISIAQNSLNYDGNTPSAVAQNNLVFATAAVPGAMAGTPYYGVFSPATSLKAYNAALVGLDIPVNLKYGFSNWKNNFYVSAGFSSGTFINETYTYQYNYPASSAPFNQQGESETINKSFSNFYFAKTLNLSVGEGLPFGKNRLIIEPFLKYPIGGLGSQDIRFGAGGINLKFNFNAK